MTIEEMKKECNLAFSRANLNFDFFDIEVVVNNRLKRVLGRCMYKRIEGNVCPNRIEISGLVASYASKEDINKIIFHECAHAIATIKDGQKHGHDNYFKSICAKIGTPFNTPSTKIQFNESEDQIFKYTVTCNKCGNEMHYHRAGKVIKNIQDYNCKCGGQLSVTQNW